MRPKPDERRAHGGKRRAREESPDLRRQARDRARPEQGRQDRLDRADDRPRAQGRRRGGEAKLDGRPAGDAGGQDPEHLHEGGGVPGQGAVQDALQQVQGLPLQLAVRGVRGEPLPAARQDPVLLQRLPEAAWRWMQAPL